MLNDVLKWCARTSLIAVFWVFFLSITWNSQPLFSYANEFFVQNDLVRYIDEELGDLWAKISETAKVTFSEMSGAADKKA
jgi:hypothetical protein